MNYLGDVDDTLSTVDRPGVSLDTNRAKAFLLLLLVAIMAQNKSYLLVYL